MEQTSRSIPGLMNLILELLLNKSQTNKETSILAVPSLDAFESRINQLKKLKVLLWRNSVSFNSQKFDCLLNDRKMLFIYGEYFLTLSDKLQLENQLNLLDVEKNLLSEFKELLNELKTEPETEHKTFKQSKAWTLLGYVQTSLFTSLGYVDPLYKVERKLQYAEEDIKDFKFIFYSKILQSRVFGDKEIQMDLDSRFMELEPTINNVLAERECLQSKKAYRPANTEFLILAKDFENFRNTLGSFHVVQNHVLELCKVFRDFNDNKSPDIKTAEKVVLRNETWHESLEQFINRIEKRFLPFYPDLILPAFAALSYMKHGINMMTNEIKKCISIASANYQDSSVESLIEKFVSFPTVYYNQSSLLDLVNICTLDSTRELINKNIQSYNNSDSFKEQFNITLSGLHELHNYILLNGTLSKSLWLKLSGIMHQIILIWKQQQKEILNEQIEKESVYKNSAQIHGSHSIEEEEIKSELQNLFPTYREKDFNDFEFDSVRHEDFVQARIVKNERHFTLLSTNDIEEITRLYSNILISCTTSDWLKLSSQCKTPDYINPLLMRYKTAGLLLDNVTVPLSQTISCQLYPSLNYLTEVSLSICQGKKLLNQQKSFDFYKDSNISEVTLCLSLLRNIFDKISLLLNQWPEHPTLRDIHTVVQRILGFPVTSSISRFLTGLELLLVKMKEWEENAHKGVSLFDHMSILTQQIISWRKLELSSWKDCLNTTFQRLQSQSAKWSFWLYILLESYINKTHNQDETDYFENQLDDLKCDEISSQKLAETLLFFISKSPLVEFEARLELLLTFHCHAFYFTSSPERDEVLSITWNVYNYYKQFTDEVNTRINSIRVPIEKKLKDFVKITRWNDISYWAVKETIAKSHRTLHKFIKEYEKGLQENVTSCLLVKPSNNNLIINKDISKNEKLMINSDIFILTTESIQKLDIEYTQHNIVLKPDDLNQIAGKLKNVIATSEYSEIRMNLENLIEDYIERSVNLKKIEIDNTLPKLKQISHAKSILQQKKKAMADYFKIIAHLGISYRIGILAWNNKQDTVIDLMIPPIDLNAALRHFDSNADKSMLEQWKGCEHYYQKSVAEFIALTQMLCSAHEDLGPLNVERFKGYSAHMLLMANEQKITLTEKVKYFVALRSQMLSLTKMKDDDNSNLPKQLDLFENARSFKKLLIVLQSSFNQLQLCLNACPSKSDIEENEIYDFEKIDLPILYATKEDSILENINSVIKDYSHLTGIISSQFSLIFHNVENCFENELNVEECVPILTMDHFNYLRESYKSLENLRIKLNEIEKVFSAEQNLNHPLIRSIKYINQIISKGIESFNEIQNKTTVHHDKQVANNNLFEFEKILLDLLRITLNTLLKDKVSSKTVNSSGELTEQLKKNSLSEFLIKSLKNKITETNLEDVFRDFNKLIFMIYDLDTVSANVYFQMIKKCLPLLEQYLLYTQFYLNEQVACLRLTCKMLHLQLNVFLDLATNGFCAPKNLDLDLDNNEETSSQETSKKGGMGLSNEEGVQDVSERIENEDQLEEAKSKDQEEQDVDNKSCAEEENGIDMSEDFEGKLQDIEKEENDGSENSDEDDADLDKEMGETNEEANQQEKEMWGDDEKEDDESRENPKEDDNAGKGEDLDDKTMGAKNSDESLPEGSKENQEKEEISEMNEPDINDDQIDPYHGNQQPEIEPEALDLPDDINLDNEDEGVDPDKQEDLFDIDNMKEPMLPPEDEAKEGDDEELKEDTENNEADKEESNADSEDDDSSSNKNIERAPMESETGDTEDLKDDTEENDDKEQQTVPSTDDLNTKTDNAMQVDVGMEGPQNDVNEEAAKDEKTSGKENVQDSQNNYGTGKSNQGLGRTEASLNGGGAQTDQSNNEENTNKKRKTPKEVKNGDTTLMEANEPALKKKKANIQERQNEEGFEDNNMELDNEAENKKTEFRHVDSKESYDRCAIDAATEDQVKEQATKISIDNGSEETEEPMDVNMLHEDEIVEEENIPNNQIQKPEQVSSTEDKSKGKSSAAKNEGEQMQIDSDLPIIETTNVERGSESSFYTNLENLSLENVSNSKEFERTRDEVKQILAHWRCEPSTEEAITTWNAVSLLTDTAARELSEKLRLVLEPTQASRLKGDYKTGKRINMRKIIPYIASQFRKDKIWLRRTKPSKRNYQIILAIDDSSSMVDNDSKEIAFESLSLISKAMTYLEAGQLGVISFGEDINVLHPLGEVFTQESGAR